MNRSYYKGIFMKAMLLFFVAAVSINGSLFAQIETPNISHSMSEGILAFPGAEGFGRFTTGGRGGVVYEVTNLNDNGPGSLRFGVEMDGPRIIIFRLSGTIVLATDLKITKNNISIFGQTAPGDGIALSGRSTVIDADNVIIQHVRFRPGDIGTGDLDGLDALWGRENKDIIIDHVSLSWSVDETGSFYDNQNFTLQWSILSESMYSSKHSKSEHGYGGIWGGIGATFHHNLLAHHSSRNPRFNGARYTTNPDNELVDYRNNVIYNWGNNSAYGGENGNHNMVANYYKAGPATPNSQKLYRILDAEGDGQWYIEDNFVYGYPAVTENNWVSAISDGIQAIQGVHPNDFETFRVHTPLDAPELPSFETAEEAYLNVLANAGAILPRRDTVDARVVKEVETGTATYGGIYGAGTGIIDSQEDVGGWPELLTAQVPQDTDGDGIPDEWETTNNLDPNNPDDGIAVDSTSGYAYVELYIHTLTGSGEFEPVPSSVQLLWPVKETNVSVRPDFTWLPAIFATSYDLEIRDGAGDHGTIIVDSTLTDTSMVYPEGIPALQENETYFWRVRGTNASGPGNWSGYEYFVTEMGTPIETNPGLPKQFKLEPNYPNPFNPSTVISYQLPVSSKVELMVFDMLGREVSRLVSGVQQAGSHTAEFDASGFSSGVYIYQLRAIAADGSGRDLFVRTRKMTLLK